MEYGNFSRLTIGVEAGKCYVIENVEDHSIPDLYEFLKETIQTGNLKYLNAFYDDENYYIDARAEGTRSYVLIHDDINGISYNYCNPKYADDFDMVEVSGYEAPHICICEEPNTLLEIIVSFLQTGKPCEKYEWLENEE